MRPGCSCLYWPTGLVDDRPRGSPRRRLRHCEPSSSTDEAIGSADDEGGSAAGAGALGGDPAVVGFDELLRDGQAEPDAVVRPGGVAVGLPEAIEDVRQKRRIDPGAGIADANLGGPIHRANRDA